MDEREFRAKLNDAAASSASRSKVPTAWWGGPDGESS